MEGMVKRRIFELKPKIAGYVGLVSVIVFIACWVIGALVDEEWILFEDNICNLGISDVPFIRILYPIGCTITGLGLMLFGYSVAKSCDRKLLTLGYYVCMIFGLSLIGIGVVSLDINEGLHMFFVYIMGISAGIVLALITVDDIAHRRWFISAFVILIAIGYTYFTIFDDSYQQPFTISCMLLWLMIKCRYMILTDRAH